MNTFLKQRIQTKKVRIAVVGLGYVGLPLAVSFAKKGFSVTGLDNDRDRVNQICEEKSYISDVSQKELKAVIRSGCFRAGMDFTLLRESDVILICVPTPLKRKYTPDVSFIMSAVRVIKKYLHKNTLVVLESTTYPGTTEEMIAPELEKSGLKIGKDFFLAFSPERIDPGNKKYPVTRIPKVVGGMTEQCGELTRLLYKKVIKDIHVVSSAKAAEMTKLLENTFRIINIGWVNEAAMMCQKMGIDVWEVIEAAKTKPFGFMPFYPGLGVGGHCIPDDPLYLYWKAKHHGFSSRFIKLSADINRHMPDYVKDRLAELLKKDKKTLAKARVLLLGVTYKKDVKDLRKSPPLRLIEVLQKERVSVDYHDPLIPYLKIGTIDLVSVALSPKRIRQYDYVFITSDHTDVDYGLVLKHAKRVYDLRNVYKGTNKKIVKF